jgi:hypothetical protein
LLSGRLIEPPPEIGTPQILTAIAGAASDLACGDAKIGKLRDQHFGIEGGVNGVARPRVIESEIEQSARGQA